MHAVPCLHFQETVQSVGFVPSQLRQPFATSVGEPALPAGHGPLSEPHIFGCLRLGKLIALWGKAEYPKVQLLVLTRSCRKSGACKVARSWCYLSHPRCAGCLCARLLQFKGWAEKAGLELQALMGQHNPPWTSSSWSESQAIYPSSSRGFGPASVGCQFGFCHAHLFSAKLCPGWEHALWSKRFAVCQLQTTGNFWHSNRGKHAVSCRFTPCKTPLTFHRYLQVISSQVNPEVFIAQLRQWHNGTLANKWTLIYRESKSMA